MVLMLKVMFPILPPPLLCFSREWAEQWRGSTQTSDKRRGHTANERTKKATKAWTKSHYESSLGYGIAFGFERATALRAKHEIR